MLKTVRDTFPAYTLHDERHARNVVGLMNELAGPRIGQVDPLEAALLILSAYFHDIGMVYSAEDRARVPGDEEFSRFLRREPDAYLAVHRHGGAVPAAVLERYCRERHAVRVREHLDRLELAQPQLLAWDGMSLVSALDRVCRSHNESADVLRTGDFDEFLGVADLRFCAMLLRLADLMDFGRSRAPRIIYDYLGLARPGYATAAESAEHWHQQMHSRGFLFPREDPASWPSIYQIGYAANPRDPAVEHAIRSFLGMARTELQQCRPIRDQCRAGLRDLPLPGDIDVRQVESKGYTYGDFRFELDRASVLELFTGEELYDDQYAFLRELLQNAIDTVLARERIHGSFPHPHVAVTSWEDGDGFTWVRIDDNGLGMDERLLRDYFLRVGRSYYKSAEFEAQLVRRQQEKAFVPISRFGIGVLSCFLAGDRIEVSTRHLVRGGDEPETGTALRLSLRRDRDFFVLRRAGQGPDDMPAGPRGDRGFRRHAGTSIAVRIDPRRTGIRTAGIAAKVEDLLLSPPISVTVNGEAAGRRHSATLDDVWRPEPHVARIDTADRESRIGALPFIGSFDVVTVPIDLDRTTSVTGVGGRLIALLALPASSADGTASDLLAGWPKKPAGLAGRPTDAVTEVTCRIRTARYSEQPDVEITVDRYVDQATFASFLDALAPFAGLPLPPMPGGTETERAVALAEAPVFIWDALDRHSLQTPFPVSYREVGHPSLSSLFRHEPPTRWAHHGVVLPVGPPAGPLFNSVVEREAVLGGIVLLGGALRPELTISREAVRAVSFPVQSAAHLAIHMALRGSTAPSGALRHLLRLDLFGNGSAHPFSVAELRSDALLTGGRWNDEDVIPTPNGMVSVNALLAAVAQGEQPPVGGSALAYLPGKQSFYGGLAAALLAFFVPIVYEPAATRGSGRLVAVAHTAADQISDLLPPLYAVPFRGPAGLAQADSILNATHPLVQWISRHAAALARDFPLAFRLLVPDAPWRLAVDDVNDALEQVARSCTDIPAPPPEAYVYTDENGWWWSRD
ncbi:HD domain-containing protein [Symbioplanes lichenis]|uniref:HD domain-containing protein n=1 Tax=Symbioplanes lichenis TaxID=1629072 RepID=UPI002739FC54|nr:hypothetical protein [Actinoplanes lichenis]